MVKRKTMEPNNLNDIELDIEIESELGADPELIEMEGRYIYRSLDGEEDVNPYIGGDFELIGFQIDLLTFRSNHSSSRYYGINHLAAVCHIEEEEHLPLTEGMQCIIDYFGAALLRGLVVYY